MGIVMFVTLGKEENEIIRTDEIMNQGAIFGLPRIGMPPLAFLLVSPITSAS